GGRRRWCRNPGAAIAGAGELNEIRCGRAVMRVRHILGCRGDRGRLARVRRRAADAHRPLRWCRAALGAGIESSKQGIDVIAARLKGLVTFWYRFFVWGDWIVAGGVVVALGFTD